MDNYTDQQCVLDCNEHLQRKAHSTPRILCIDDDVDIQTTIELRMLQYDVLIDHAYYSIQGIVKAGQSHPDLILLDLSMPSGDGQYLLRPLKDNPETANIPVIVLTGARDPSLKASLLFEGADVFLKKPIRFDDLLQEIRRYVEIRTLKIEGEVE